MINRYQTKYPVKVIDNKDPLLMGRVQIYFEPFMHGWKPSDYPWAFACKSGNGGSSDFGVSDIPEVDTWVWAWHEKEEFKNWFYGEDLHWQAAASKQINPHRLFLEKIKSKIMSLADYPDVKYKYFKNEISLGVSSSDSAKEVYVYHPSGTYIMIKNNGDVIVKLNDKMEIDGDIVIKGNIDVEGDMSLDGGIEVSGDVVAGPSGATVSLNNHQHTTGAPGSPTSPPTPGT